MKENFAEVKSMNKLAELWALHATSIAALPLKEKAYLITLKDQVKERLQKL